MRQSCTQPGCIQLRCESKRKRTFDVINSIAIECVRAQQGVYKVSTILGVVMNSRNSKTIEQRWSDSGRRLGDDCECNTGPDVDPN